MMKTPTDGFDCDLLVIGTGAAGFTAAVTAAKAGLAVVMIEKDSMYGGTSATSGGMLWVPGNHHSPALAAKHGVTDSLERARAYILDEAGNHADRQKIEAYLAKGPEMIAYLERETEVKFYGLDYPDYHSENPNATVVRSVATVDYHASKLGPHIKDMKNQLTQTLFLGLAIGSSVEMKQFMQAGRSIKSLWFVTKKMSSHFRDLIKYGRSEQMVRGRALIGRLAKTAFDLGIPIWLSSPARDLIVEDGTVRGAIVARPDGEVRITARKAVVLAAGGFPRDADRRKAVYPAVVERTNRRSVAAAGNTGDSARFAEKAGGRFDDAVSNVASWMPISIMPGVEGTEGVWPHLVERTKPGFVAVLKNGKRFTDESASYHDFVAGLIQACEKDEQAYCFIVGDHRAVNHFGIGFARPFPMPRGHLVRAGYLNKGRTLRELATQAGIDPDGLERTMQAFNANAQAGRDPDFGRGTRVYDLYQGDQDVTPNPCLRALTQAPFYAVKVFPGEIGTFAGIKTDAYARVLNDAGLPIPGLYAVGNDQTSVWGGAYPGAGSTLGPGMTFGYIAGRHVAGLLPSAPL